MLKISFDIDLLSRNQHTEFMTDTVNILINVFVLFDYHRMDDECKGQKSSNYLLL